mmetsp:Transcript_6908/g.17251  ORF Transcript_6908/g.17251 Transcript_6908/m.17251 type:complete len:253 (+) Transcript_6908:514-1272(+)
MHGAHPAGVQLNACSRRSPSASFPRCSSLDCCRTFFLLQDRLYAYHSAGGSAGQPSHLMTPRPTTLTFTPWSSIRPPPRPLRAYRSAGGKTHTDNRCLRTRCPAAGAGAAACFPLHTFHHGLLPLQFVLPRGERHASIHSTANVFAFGPNVSAREARWHTKSNTLHCTSNMSEPRARGMGFCAREQVPSLLGRQTSRHSICCQHPGTLLPNAAKSRSKPSEAGSDASHKWSSCESYEQRLPRQKGCLHRQCG